MGLTDTKTTDVDLSQKEKILKRSDKGKSIVEQTPSSSKGKYLMEHVPRWLRKDVIRKRRQKYSTQEEDMRELIEVLRKLESPPKDAWELSFIMSYQNHNLFSHVSIPPLHADVEELIPKDYQIREVVVGKPTLDTAKLMVKNGIREMFRHLEQDDTKLTTL